MFVAGGRVINSLLGIQKVGDDYDIFLMME